MSHQIRKKYNGVVTVFFNCLLLSKQNVSSGRLISSEFTSKTLKIGIHTLYTAILIDAQH